MTTIVLWVEDLKSATDFYCKLLAADAGDVSEEFTRVMSPQNEVLLHAVPEQFRSGLSTPLQVREDAVIKPVFAVASIEAARDSVIETAGVVFGIETENRYGATNYCDGFDTEGNVFQLAQS